MWTTTFLTHNFICLVSHRCYVSKDVRRGAIAISVYGSRWE